MELISKYVKPIGSPEAKGGCNFMEEKLLESFEVGKAPEYLLTSC